MSDADGGGAASASAMSYSAAAALPEAAPAAAAAAAFAVPQMRVQESATAALFTVERPAFISSDTMAHKVVVGLVELNSTFQYVAVPRAAAQAFLTMRSTNLSPFPLLPGPVKARWKARPPTPLFHTRGCGACKRHL